MQETAHVVPDRDDLPITSLLRMCRLSLLVAEVLYPPNQTELREVCQTHFETSLGCDKSQLDHSIVQHSTPPRFATDYVDMHDVQLVWEREAARPMHACRWSSTISILSRRFSLAVVPRRSFPVPCSLFLSFETLRRLVYAGCFSSSYDLRCRSHVYVCYTHISLLVLPPALECYRGHN